MKYLRYIFILAFSLIQADDFFSNHLQLIVVTNRYWRDVLGTLVLFERADEYEEWTQVYDPIPVVLGKSGMAKPFEKFEGDLMSPSGIFSLGPIFGFQKEAINPNMDYLHLNEFIEAVDDESSAYYNHIVDNREVPNDWDSSEKMRSEPLYEMGLVIQHNWPHPTPCMGSAIFMHSWKSPRLGTAGCTAMDPKDLEKVLLWLNKDKNPILIQLPESIYAKLERSDLPVIDSTTWY